MALGDERPGYGTKSDGDLEEVAKTQRPYRLLTTFGLMHLVIVQWSTRFAQGPLSALRSVISTVLGDNTETEAGWGRGTSPGPTHHLTRSRETFATRQALHGKENLPPPVQPRANILKTICKHKAGTINAGCNTLYAQFGELASCRF